MEAALTRRKRLVLYGVALTLGGYLGYRAYRSDAASQYRASLSRLRLALQRYSEALSSSADLCCSLVRDLQSFLQSDSAEVPGSLRQLARLLQSQEVAQTTASTVSAVYRGLAGSSSTAAVDGSGTNGSSSSSSDSAIRSRGAVDKVLDALLSDRGQTLVSVAVSMGARNLVGGLVEATARTSAGQQQQQPGVVDKILDFCATDRGRALAVAAITAFVTNGVRVYMDATLDVNFYEDIFSSMSRPQHLEAVKQCVGMFAREAVGTALQGSPQRSPERQQSQRSRAVLLEELSPPSPSSSAGTPRQQQRQPVCSEFRGSPMDSAFRSSSPSLQPSASSGRLASGEETTNPGGQQLLEQQRLGRTPSADDLDSDSLLHGRQKEAGDKQAQQPGPSLTWLPAVTKEVLTVVKDPNARSVLVGAAGATAHEFSTAVVAGLGQLEVVQRWGLRGVLALLLLSFLTVCLAQELLRATVLAVLR